MDREVSQNIFDVPPDLTDQKKLDYLELANILRFIEQQLQTPDALVNSGKNSKGVVAETTSLKTDVTQAMQYLREHKDLQPDKIKELGTRAKTIYSITK